MNCIHILPFLVTTLLVSFSGVVSPGPLTAVTLSYGLNNKYAGVLVSVGHGIIELPLIALISLGITKFLKPEIKTFIGTAGGLVLIIYGIQMFRQKDLLMVRNDRFYPGVVLSGMITTVSNPYFFIWWFTVGTGLIITAVNFGIAGIILFTIVHLSCDFLWYSLLTNLIYKTGHLFPTRVWNIIFFICSATLIFFGILFICKYTGVTKVFFSKN